MIYVHILTNLVLGDVLLPYMDTSGLYTFSAACWECREITLDERSERWEEAERVRQKRWAEEDAQQAEMERQWDMRFQAAAILAFGIAEPDSGSDSDSDSD
jgi:hypothetical protein